MNIADIPNLYLPTTFAPATTHVAGHRVRRDSGLRHCLIDDLALTALDTLVVGPVKNWETLESAELCIRAFVLHERADLLLPAVLVTLRGGATGGLTTVKYAPPNEPQAIMGIVHEAALHNRPVFTEWLRISNGSLLDDRSFWTGRDEVLLGSDRDALRSAFADYTLADTFLPAFAATPSAVGAPSYFGIGPTREYEAQHLKEGVPAPSQRFLEQIDEAWKERLAKYQLAGLDVRLGPFLGIVLDRAARRPGIPDVVISLRREFETARERFWDMFEELRNETDGATIAKRCSEIETAAKAIIPAAFPVKWQPLRLALGVVAGLPSIVGALPPFLEQLLERNVPQRHVSAVDAAKLLSKGLKALGDNVIPPLQKHLTSSELSALRIQQ